MIGIMKSIWRNNASIILSLSLIAIGATISMSCNGDQSITDVSNAPGDKFGRKLTTAIDYGAAHNSALSNVASVYTQSDFPSFTSGSASAAWDSLYKGTVPIVVSAGLDTSGLSLYKQSIKSDFFVVWWPDSAVRPPSNYSTVMANFNNRSAIERVIFWLDDTDPTSMTKLQYKNALDTICDSLLTALGSQSWVETELAFV